MHIQEADKSRWLLSSNAQLLIRCPTKKPTKRIKCLAEPQKRDVTGSESGEKCRAIRMTMYVTQTSCQRPFLAYGAELGCV